MFRLEEHVKRLFNSCRIYRREIPFSSQVFQDAILETIRANQLEHCYIRPLIFVVREAWDSTPLKLPRNASYWYGNGDAISGKNRSNRE